MRKLLMAAVVLAAVPGAGVALGDQAATAPNGEFIDLNVSVTPPVAGTAHKPQGVGVTFNSFTGNRINGNTPSQNNSITVRFNRGFVYDGGRFPSCTINQKALTVCAKRTQVGTGTAEASTAGVPNPTFIPATLAAYNGKPVSGKNPTLIFIASIGGKPVTELDFVVKREITGPYGLAFDEIVAPGSTTSSLGITKFSISIPDRTVTRKIAGHKVKIHLVDAPTTCQKVWRFAQINGFASGPPLTATATQSCAKH
jgi:hypothetical protein